MIFRDKRLIQPSSRQVDTVGQLVDLAQRRGGTGDEAIVRDATKYHIVDTKAFDQRPFVWRIAIFIDHENIGHDLSQFWLEIQIARPAGNKRLMHPLDIFHHEQTFLFGVHRRTSLQIEHGLV